MGARMRIVEDDQAMPEQARLAIGDLSAASPPAIGELPAPSRATSPELRAARRTDLACRALDLVLGTMLLVASLPLMAAIAVAIRLDSPGPALFRQRRVGRGSAQFIVRKFRTMRHGASDEVHREFVLALIAGDLPPAVTGGPRFKLSGDQRVTRIGRLLRSSSLDELPQLFNVVRGEMSLVGPRPPIPYEVERYPAHWLRRLDVRPGLTGLWQVSGRCELTVEEMVSLDVEYVQRRSLAMNAWILLRTVPVVLSRRGAS
jgi:lipopolysaccharide/colanic/teichoic acid biosynthesis glycosyltransferase